MQSEYMQWAKTAAQPKYSLASSGVMNFPLKDLGIAIEDLELTRPAQYGYYGFAPLQNALAEKSRVSPENIVAANGTSMANFLAMAAFLQPGDEVLIEQPTYEPLLAVLHYLKARLKTFNRRFENGFRVEPEEIKRNLGANTRLIVFTNLHNPSGVLTDLKTLKVVGEIAKSAGIKVLVDEVYLESLYPDTAAYSAFALGDHFFTTSSLTKAYGLSGLRCGWIVAETGLSQKIWKLNDLFGVMPVHSAELMSVIALQKLDAIAERAKSLLSTNRAVLQKFFEQSVQLEVVMPLAGTIAFPRLKKGNVDRFCKLLVENYETGVVPGRFFGMPDHFRIGIGCTTETLAAGLERLDLALREHKF